MSLHRKTLFQRFLDVHAPENTNWMRLEKTTIYNGAKLAKNEQSAETMGIYRIGLTIEKAPSGRYAFISRTVIDGEEAVNSFASYSPTGRFQEGAVNIFADPMNRGMDIGMYESINLRHCYDLLTDVDLNTEYKFEEDESGDYHATILREFLQKDDSGNIPKIQWDSIRLETPQQ